MNIMRNYDELCKGRITLTLTETLEKITGLDNFQIAPLDVNILTIAAELGADLECTICSLWLQPVTTLPPSLPKMSGFKL